MSGQRLTKHGFPDARAYNGRPFKPIEQKGPPKRERICVYLPEPDWFEVEFEAGHRRMSVSAVMRWAWELARPHAGRAANGETCLSKPWKKSSKSCSPPQGRT